MKETPLFSSYEESVKNGAQDSGSCELQLKYLLKKHEELPGEDPFATYPVLAGCYLLASPDLLAPELSHAVHASLWEVLQQSRYSLAHERVIAVLARLTARDEVVRKRYLDLVADRTGSKTLRLMFIKSLGTSGNTGVTEPLLALLLGLRERDWELLLPLRDALVSLEASEMVPKILALVRQKGLNVRLRGALAGVVGKLGKSYPDVVTLLLAILLDAEEDETVRIFVASALGDLGDQSVVPPMCNLLKEIATAGEAWSVVDEAEQLALFDAREEQGEDEEDDGTASGRMIGKRCPDILAVPLVCALEHLLLPTQIPDLLPLLRAWHINIPARNCLASIIATKSAPIVLQNDVLPLVSDRSIPLEVRETLALVCGERLDAQLILPLQQITEVRKVEREIERAILVARAKLGDQIVVKTLRKVLRYKNFRSSSHYVQSGLIRCIDLATVMQLMENREADLFLRRLAVALLPQRSEQEQSDVIPHLLRIVRSSSESVDMRQEIVKTLEEIGREPASLAALLPQLGGNHAPELADDACRALWAICCRMGRTLVASEKGYQLVRPETLVHKGIGEK